MRNVQIGRCGNDFTGLNDGAAFPTMPDGTFDMRGVEPGAYCLIASENVQQRSTYASVPVTVKNRDVDGVVIETESGFDVSGSVRTEGTALPKPRIYHIMFHSLEPAMADVGTSTTSDGAFLLHPVFSGEYELEIQNLTPSLYVKSVKLGGQDASGGTLAVTAGSPLSVVMGTDPGQVTGTVDFSSGQMNSIWVVAAPPDGPLSARADLIKTAYASGQNGQFAVRGWLRENTRFSRSMSLRWP